MLRMGPPPRQCGLVESPTPKERSPSSLLAFKMTSSGYYFYRAVVTMNATFISSFNPDNKLTKEVL